MSCELRAAAVKRLLGAFSLLTEIECDFANEECSRLIARSSQLLPIFAPYDTRKDTGYEGPCGGPEEVSLTSITDYIKSPKTSNCR
jgi:hypothetical protein